MKLAVKQRVGEKKKDVKDVRREGNIPAIIYSSKGQPEKLEVNGTEFQAILREMKSGQLPTTLFTLHDGNKERRAIIKDIQYHITSYIVTHIDFEELVDGVTVCVKVPVNCTGVAECMGIKLGGFFARLFAMSKWNACPSTSPQSSLSMLGI